MSATTRAGVAEASLEEMETDRDELLERLNTHECAGPVDLFLEQRLEEATRTLAAVREDFENLTTMAAGYEAQRDEALDDLQNMQESPPIATPPDCVCGAGSRCRCSAVPLSGTVTGRVGARDTKGIIGHKPPGSKPPPPTPPPPVLRFQFDEAIRQRDIARDEMNDVRTRAANTELQLTEMGRELERIPVLTAQLSDAWRERDEASTDRDDIKADLDRVLTELDGSLAINEDSNVRATLFRVKGERDQMRIEGGMLSECIGKLETDLEEVIEQATRLETERDEMREERDAAYQGSEPQSQEEITRLTNQVSVMQTVIDGRNTILEQRIEAQVKVIDLSKDLDKVREQLRDTEAALHVARALIPAGDPKAEIRVALMLEEQTTLERRVDRLKEDLEIVNSKYRGMRSLRDGALALYEGAQVALEAMTVERDSVILEDDRLLRAAAQRDRDRAVRERDGAIADRDSGREAAAAEIQGYCRELANAGVRIQAIAAERDSANVCAQEIRRERDAARESSGRLTTFTQEEFEELRDRIAGWERRHDTVCRERDRRDARIEDYQESCTRRDEILAGITQEKEGLEEQVTILKRERDDTQERLLSGDLRTQDSVVTIAALREELENLKAYGLRQVGKHEKTNKKLGDTQRKLGEARRVMGIESGLRLAGIEKRKELEQQITALQALKASDMPAITGWRHQVVVAEERLGDAQSKITQLVERRDEAYRDAREMKERLDQAIGHIDELTGLITGERTAFSPVDAATYIRRKYMRDESADHETPRESGDELPREVRVLEGRVEVLYRNGGTQIWNPPAGECQARFLIHSPDVTGVIEHGIMPHCVACDASYTMDRVEYREQDRDPNCCNCGGDPAGHIRGVPDFCDGSAREIVWTDPDGTDLGLRMADGKWVQPEGRCHTDNGVHRGDAGQPPVCTYCGHDFIWAVTTEDPRKYMREDQAESPPNHASEPPSSADGAALRLEGTKRWLCPIAQAAEIEDETPSESPEDPMILQPDGLCHCGMSKVGHTRGMPLWCVQR